MFRSAPEDRRLDPLRALGAGAIVVGFCFLLLWHDPLLFWNDDYEVSILPVFADVARSWSEGHLPLLSPYSWVCSNLAGEFQYGTFSIFVNAVVILIWKFPLTFPQQAAALSMAHLFLLAAGAFLLARDRNLSTPLSMMVALIASLNGWIICWGATDWFGALAAFTWLPWAWWGLARALDQRRSRWRFLWPAPFVYLLIAGGFPYTVLMLALLIAWLAVKASIQTRKLSILWPLLAGSALGLAFLPRPGSLFSSMSATPRGPPRKRGLTYNGLYRQRRCPVFYCPHGQLTGLISLHVSCHMAPPRWRVAWSLPSY